MKKNKTIGGILVIVGGLLAIAGIFLPNFLPDKKLNKKNHVEEQDICKEVKHEEKTKIVAEMYTDNEVNYQYKLATNAIEFEEYIDGFSYDLEEVSLDFSSYDYLIYYVNNKKLCNRNDYLTHFEAYNNVVRLELTKNDFNTTECDYFTTYAHVLEIEKGILEKNVVVNVTNKDDPQKDCYKK